MILGWHGVPPRLGEKTSIQSSSLGSCAISEASSPLSACRSIGGTSVGYKKMHSNQLHIKNSNFSVPLKMQICTYILYIHIRYIVILLHYNIYIYHVLLLHRQHHVYSVLHVNFIKFHQNDLLWLWLFCLCAPSIRMLWMGSSVLAGGMGISWYQLCIALLYGHRTKKTQSAGCLGSWA